MLKFAQYLFLHLYLQTIIWVVTDFELNKTPGRNITQPPSLDLNGLFGVGLVARELLQYQLTSIAKLTKNEKCILTVHTNMQCKSNTQPPSLNLNGLWIAWEWRLPGSSEALLLLCSIVWLSSVNRPTQQKKITTFTIFIRNLRHWIWTACLALAW